MKILRKEIIINFLISLFPISFIAGNLIINLNIIILILLSIFFYKKEIFNLNYYLLDKLIFSFFALVLFTGIYNDVEFYISGEFQSNFNTIVKSILFLKYLLLYLVVRYLIEQNIIKIKIFYISCSVLSVFVAFDIFYQFIFGEDIFGFEAKRNYRRLSGPFGDELVAGGYLQRFSMFVFFVIPVFFSERFEKYLKFFIPIIFLIFALSILLTGNRMPLILFSLSIFLILLIKNPLRKFFAPILVIFPIVFAIVYHSNYAVKNNYSNFVFQLNKMVGIVAERNFYNIPPSHLKEFASFYDTWLMNKFVGGGIKNFRYYCHIRPNAEEYQKKCNMHPHNYYLEVLTETGIIGLMLILTIFLNVIYLFIKNQNLFKNRTKYNQVYFPFFILFLIEIFPIKSTGSFFTTGNTTYFFLILSILISLLRKQNSIENEH